MPLLINWNIFQLCTDFSQLPNKHTGFILHRLTISLVCSGSFQFSTLFLLKDLFSWVEFKNSEHLITLSQAYSLRERGVKARQGLCHLNPSSQGICFSFWRQIRCSNQAVLWGRGWVSTKPLTRLIPQQHIPSSWWVPGLRSPSHLCTAHGPSPQLGGRLQMCY